MRLNLQNLESWKCKDFKNIEVPSQKRFSCTCRKFVTCWNSICLISYWFCCIMLMLVVTNWFTSWNVYHIIMCCLMTCVMYSQILNFFSLLVSMGFRLPGIHKLHVFYTVCRVSVQPNLDKIWRWLSCKLVIPLEVNSAKLCSLFVRTRDGKLTVGDRVMPQMLNCKKMWKLHSVKGSVMLDWSNCNRSPLSFFFFHFSHLVAMAGLQFNADSTNSATPFLRAHCRSTAKIDVEAFSVSCLSVILLKDHTSRAANLYSLFDMSFTVELLVIGLYSNATQNCQLCCEP